MNYKVGEYVFIGNLFKFGKVKSFRTNGSVKTLWVDVKGLGEFPINTLDFVTWTAKVSYDETYDTQVIKAKSIINVLGFIACVVASILILR